MKVIKKTYSLLEDELALIEQIKDKCLNKKLDLGVGEITRLSLYITAELSEEKIKEAAKKLPRIPMGRPKKDQG